LIRHILNQKNIIDHVHPIEMGYHVIVGEENHVHQWCSLGQSDVESWLYLATFVVGVNSMVVESM